VYHPVSPKQYFGLSIVYGNRRVLRVHYSNFSAIKCVGRITMSVAKVTEITASSSKSFEDAIQMGISRAIKTLENVQSAWIQDQEVALQGGKITEYKVRMKVTFVLND
jgi:flavin-binding protein dodecin